MKVILHDLDIQYHELLRGGLFKGWLAKKQPNKFEEETK